MMKTLFLVLALVSLSFAATEWQTISFLAVFTAFMVLLILYMLSYLVDSGEMRMLARQEMTQVFLTLIFIAVFIAFEVSATGAFSAALGEAFGGADHITYATEIVTEYSDQQWDALQSLTALLTIPLGSLASMSGTCSIMGSSFTYPGCIGIQVPFSSLMFATNVLVTAMLANNSQIMLLKLAETFFFPVLLPFGLFLRCFHFTRGAGSLLIAIAFSFYFIFPISIMITAGMAEKLDKGDPFDYMPYDINYPSENFGEEFTAGMDSAAGIAAAIATGGASLLFAETNADCNPLEMDPNAGRKQAEHLVGDKGGDLVESLLYMFFIKGLFTTMLNILITLSAVRGLAKIFGAEVDISALARIS